MPDGGSLPLVGDAGGAAGHAVRIARRRRHEGRLMEDALPMRPEVKLSGWRGHLTALAIVACTILALFHRDLLRSEEHTSELQSLMRISYAVFCLKKKKNTKTHIRIMETQRRKNTITITASDH